MNVSYFCRRFIRKSLTENRHNVQPTGIELLAPARNLEYGRTAVDFGADAVYIGGPAFGARSAVPNSMEEIGKLAQYAHRFGAKVYLAINTVLYDGELKKAERLARDAWNAGVDALIVQDMAFMEMDLPPVPLHASTQTFNLDPEKIVFLENAGFSRVVLERAAGLADIHNIRSRTGVELEAFIHGAICVSYSGQCYMSHAIAGRSGNRGECLQPCRWDYDLYHEGKKIVEGKHLLSVGDLNMTGELDRMVEAGITSFKIEGRLKDLAYLKNTVSHYRRVLDRIIGANPGLRRTSSGESGTVFEPDPVRTFSRVATTYYFTDRRNRVGSFDSPKSTGEPLGVVKEAGKNYFILQSARPLNNGDGICFIGSGGVMTGTHINRTEGERIFPNRMDGIRRGTVVSRNYDHAFVRSVEKATARRTLPIEAEFYVRGGDLTLALRDADGITASATVSGPFETASKPERMAETLETNLKKTGESPYRIAELVVRWEKEPLFVPASVLNRLRREALENLDARRLKGYRRKERKKTVAQARYPAETLDFTANVTNRLAERFYRQRGVETIESGFERLPDPEGREVMRTRYCIRRETDCCLKNHPARCPGKLRLGNKNHIFDLAFDCVRCEMSVIYSGKNENP